MRTKDRWVAFEISGPKTFRKIKIKIKKFRNRKRFYYARKNSFLESKIYGSRNHNLEASFLNKFDLLRVHLFFQEFLETLS